MDNPLYTINERIKKFFKQDVPGVFKKMNQAVGFDDENGVNIAEKIGDGFSQFGDNLSKFGSGLEGLLNQMISDPETYWDYFRNGKANEWNYLINQETNAANLQIAQETNKQNKEIANENLGFQRELQEYNKALQNRVFEREDTSYQRTARDMLSAGLNPLSMQGTNGAGEIISQNTLHNDYQAQQSNPMQSFQVQAGGLQTVLSTFASIAQSVENLFTGKRQRDLLQTQIDKNKFDNLIYTWENNLPYTYFDKKGLDMQRNLPGQNKGIQSYNRWIDFSRKDREFAHMIDTGKYDTDLREERILTAVEDWLNNGRLKKLLDNSLETLTDSGTKLLKQLGIFN